MKVELRKFWGGTLAWAKKIPLTRRRRQLEGTFPGAEQTSDIGPEAKERFRALLSA